MNKKNMTVPNLNYVVKDGISNFKDFKDCTLSLSPSKTIIDDGINYELEQLRIKIKSEIAERTKSNLKHNIVYIPSLEETTEEEFCQELKLLKEKISSAENACLYSQSQPDSHYNNVYDATEKAIVRIELQSLLEEKIFITKEIQKMVCIEDVLRCKIKFKENIDSIALDLKINCKDFSEKNTVTLYRKQWRSIITEQNELKNQLTEIDLKISSVMLNARIPPDDKQFLKHNLDLKSDLYEHQTKHTNNIKSIFIDELNLKEKFIHIMAEMLSVYNIILRKNSLLTKQMTDNYHSIIRTAQGLGIVNFLFDKPTHSEARI